MNRTAICGEYLGVIDARALLQNLKGINEHISSIPALLLYFKGPLIVDAKFEYEWEGDSTRPVGKRFVRLVVQPESGQCSGEWQWRGDPSGVGESWQFLPKAS